MKTTDTVARTALLERVIATLDIFPTSRLAVVQSVMRMTADMGTNIHKLEETISTDPALTGKILRLANSPFYGRMRKVSSLREGIVILGFQTIRSLVVATMTATAFRNGGQSDLLENLWRHSLAVALGSRIVAECNSGLKEEAFIAGLMHDIAKAVLLQRFPDEYQPALDAARSGGADPLEVERETLGITHAELGHHILEHWNFPPDLAHAVSRHHDPGIECCPPVTAGAAGREMALAHIVCFANELAKDRGYSFLDEPAAELTSVTALEYFGFGDDAIPELGETLDAAYLETAELFAI